MQLIFQVVAPEDTYKVHRKLEEAAIIVMGVKEPHITVTITLTSPIMREQLLTLPEGSGGKKTKRVIGSAGIIEIANQGPIMRWYRLCTYVHLAFLCCPNNVFKNRSEFLSSLKTSVSNLYSKEL